VCLCVHVPLESCIFFFLMITNINPFVAITGFFQFDNTKILLISIPTFLAHIVVQYTIPKVYMPAESF